MTIPTRRLGPDALEVGAIGYGAMSFGSPYGQSNFDKAAAAHNILDVAEELGATLLDTSDGYGDSEEVLGRAIAGRGEDFVRSLAA
ncbi:aldo/keto reductase [Streptomyces sp. NPDC005146]